jgi:hypothetical protein
MKDKQSKICSSLIRKLHKTSIIKFISSDSYPSTAISEVRGKLVSGMLLILNAADAAAFKEE